MATVYVKCVCGNEYKPSINKQCPKCQRPAAEAVLAAAPVAVDSQQSSIEAQNLDTSATGSSGEPVNAGTDPQPRLHVEKVKLFDTPFYSDKAFFIGGLIVVVMATINAYNTAYTSGVTHTGVGVISGLIDGAVYLGVGFAVFCLIPAVIRRSTRKGTLRNSRPTSTQPGAYPDPIGNGRRRYWTGTKWTDQVSDFDFPPKTSGRAIIAGLVGISALLSVAGILGIQTGAEPIKASFDAIGADIKAYNEQSNSGITTSGGSAAWAAVLAEYSPRLTADANALSTAVNSAHLSPTSTIDGVSGAAITSLANAFINVVRAIANMNQGFISCGPYASSCYDNVIFSQRDAYMAAVRNLKSAA